MNGLLDVQVEWFGEPLQSSLCRQIAAAKGEEGMFNLGFVTDVCREERMRYVFSTGL